MIIEQGQTTHQQLMQTWLDALRSGRYQQGAYGLYVEWASDEPSGYCCLGVADEVCFGATFEQRSVGKFVDDEGSDFLLSPARAHTLGLDAPLTEAEVEAANDLAGTIAHPIRASDAIGAPLPRSSALASLNDYGISFEEIADYIEKMGWNK